MGDELITNVCLATGLPLSLIKEELQSILIQEGFDLNSVTLDEIRMALAKYLQEVLLGAKEDLNTP